MYAPNRCLISDQYGGVTVSNVSSDELKQLMGVNFNINTAMRELQDFRTRSSSTLMDSRVYSLYKWWDKKMVPQAIYHM